MNNPRIVLVRNYGQARSICIVQGWFYLLAGVWPIFHPSSFEWVTGPKRDLWIAQTVGVLLVVSSAVFLSAAKRQRITAEIVALAMGEVIALAVVDVSTLWQPRTALAYCADAVVEMALLLGWLVAITRRRARSVRIEGVAS